MQSENWEDLRYLLAIHQAGSLKGAASTLGVDTATVSRRVKAAEERAGCRMFDRLRGGPVLTPEGELFVQAADQLQERVNLLRLQVTGSADALTGPLRVTCPEVISCIWVPIFDELMRTHPNLELEVVADDRFRSITRREADVAVRIVKSPPERLVGRRLGSVEVAVYGAHETDPTTAAWIMWDEGNPSAVVVEQYKQQKAANAPIAYRTGSAAFHIASVREGAGVGLFPCIFGDNDPSLVRLSEPDPVDAHLWVLTHHDLRRSPRVRAFIDLFAERWKG